MTDVCSLVCTDPPFLPLTVAIGVTLSENFHDWQTPLASLQTSPPWSSPPSAWSLLSCTGIPASLPLGSNNASIRFCTEWCLPRGLACNRSLLHTEAHAHWTLPQQCSTRWMANRDARRSKSPPAAGWFGESLTARTGCRQGLGTYCVYLCCTTLPLSAKGLFVQSKLWIGTTVVFCFRLCLYCFVVCVWGSSCLLCTIWWWVMHQWLPA